MQLFDLRKPINEMTDEELRIELLNVRRRREVTKPALKAHKKKAAKKSKVVQKSQKNLKNMSPEDLQKLIATLEKRVSDES